MEKIFDVIGKNYDTYTKSHKSVAAYIMENYDEASFMTLEQLAESAGVSTTTVIRFARELGFDGYSSMQNALRYDLRAKTSLPDRLDTSLRIPDDDFLSRVIHTDINNIEQTFKTLDPEILKKAVDCMSAAPTIYILGLRRSFSLAIYTYSRLAQVRKHVRLIGSAGMNYPEDISNAAEGDICITFLFPRYSSSTLAILNYLRSINVTVIIITSLNHLAIDKYADILIPCETSCISGKTSYVAPLSVLNYMMALYTKNNSEESREMLNKTEDILSKGMFLGI